MTAARYAEIYDGGPPWGRVVLYRGA